jgi:hypothetical protein
LSRAIRRALSCTKTVHASTASAIAASPPSMSREPTSIARAIGQKSQKAALNIGLYRRSPERSLRIVAAPPQTIDHQTLAGVHDLHDPVEIATATRRAKCDSLSRPHLFDLGRNAWALSLP